MKLFQVIYEEDDGVSYKEGTKHVTDIRKVSICYAAVDMRSLIAHINELLLDEEKTVVSIAEFAPMVHIVAE